MRDGAKEYANKSNTAETSLDLTTFIVIILCTDDTDQTVHNTTSGANLCGLHKFSRPVWLRLCRTMLFRQAPWRENFTDHATKAITSDKKTRRLLNSGLRRKPRGRLGVYWARRFRDRFPADYTFGGTATPACAGCARSSIPIGGGQAEGTVVAATARRQ